MLPSNSPEVEKLYTARLSTYRTFISFLRYRGAIQKLLEGSGLLRPGLRILDAGCGFGTATFALLEALRRRSMEPQVIDAFDLTPAMLAAFQAELEARGINQVRLRQADVLSLECFSQSWSDYDLIVSTSMLEYVAKEDFARALSALRARLSRRGALLAVITRKNWITKSLIEWWWRAARYSRQELQQALAAAGFDDLVFIRFPFRYFWHSLSNYVVVARRGE